MRVSKLNTRSNVFVGNHGEMTTFFATANGDEIECLHLDIPGVALSGDFTVLSHRDLRVPKTKVYIARSAVSSYVLEVAVRAVEAASVKRGPP